MRDFGAYTVAVAIVLSVLCCANLALASQTTPPVSNNTAVIGIAPVGNDLSLIDIGGFLRLLGGYLRVGVGASATSSAPPVVESTTFTTATSPSGNVGTVTASNSPTSWAIHDNSTSYPVPTVTYNGQTLQLYSGDGNLNNYFSINSSGVISIASTPPNGAYTFTVTATNGAGSGNGVVSVLVDFPIATSPATGQPFPGPSNTGYQNAPGYTGGALTNGASLLGTLSEGTYQGNFTANTTYTGYLFDLGNGNTMDVNAAGVTFVGCYFGSTNSGTATVFASGGGPITFKYSTFGPSPAVYGSFPPLPPGGGGYSAWPSATGTDDLSENGTTIGYSYGPITDGANSWPTGGAVTFEADDMWGSAQGMSLSSSITASNPLIWDGTWYHDPPYNGGDTGSHQDAIGYEEESGVTATYITINNSVFSGNANGHALAGTWPTASTINNITFTNNYVDWTGAAYFEWGISYPTVQPTNYVVTGNVIGPKLQLVNYNSQLVYGGYGEAQFEVSGSGNKFRNNTALAGTYQVDGSGSGNSQTVPAGYFLWPDGSLNATDWTGAY